MLKEKDIVVKFYAFTLIHTCKYNIEFKDSKTKFHDLIIRYHQNEFEVDLPINHCYQNKELEAYIIKQLHIQHPKFSKYELTFEKHEEFDLAYYKDPHFDIDYIFKFYFDQKLKIELQNTSRFAYNDLRALEKFIQKQYFVFCEGHKKQLVSSSLEPSKPMNIYERLLNANKSNYCYYPNNRLKVMENNSNKTMNDLRLAMVEQNIHLFEIDFLSLLDTFTYLTKTMVIDLFASGYISQGNRNIKRSVLEKIMKRLNTHNLANILRIVNENESELSLEIYCMGHIGNNLLKEMNRSHHFNIFDLFQNVDVVKNKLAVNQWMIYWLSNFPEQIRNNYLMHKVIRTMGVAKNGIRIYAAFKHEDSFVIGEGVRRVSEYDLEMRKIEIRDKFKRFMEVFQEQGQIFMMDGYKTVPFQLNEKQILCYICEDEEHINELYEILKDDIKLYPNANIWFTYDVKLYNYNEEGKRFLQKQNDEWVIVDLKQTLNLENEFLQTLK